MTICYHLTQTKGAFSTDTWLTHLPVNMFGVYVVFIVKINKNSLLVCMS